MCNRPARSNVTAVLIGSMEWRTTRYVITLRNRVDVKSEPEVYNG
jgi:hypothetical protein